MNWSEYPSIFISSLNLSHLHLQSSVCTSALPLCTLRTYLSCTVCTCTHLFYALVLVPLGLHGQDFVEVNGLGEDAVQVGRSSFLVLSHLLPFSIGQRRGAAIYLLLSGVL